jgi:hypothetical protein
MADKQKKLIGTADADERVMAKTLELGDEIWIPNSRHAQAIEQIFKTDQFVIVTCGDAQWNTTPDHMIRRKQKEQ